jgi:DNA-binding response OmpR family regulator
MQKILLVEDEAGIRMTLGDRLRAEGYGVEAAEDGEQGLERARDGAFDLFIFDVMMPKKNGLDLCRDIRQLGITTPVIMLTAKGQTLDKVLGLKLGADDYLTKPFDMMELLARVEALLRRSTSLSEPPVTVYEFGDIKLDPRSTEVTRNGEVLTISAKEYQLLLYLCRHPGVTLSREVLLREVWGYDSTPTTRTVDVHVAWLRQKLEDDPKHPRWITTIHGMGYKFKPE